MRKKYTDIRLAYQAIGEQFGVPLPPTAWSDPNVFEGWVLDIGYKAIDQLLQNAGRPRGPSRKPPVNAQAAKQARYRQRRQEKELEKLREEGHGLLYLLKLAELKRNKNSS